MKYKGEMNMRKKVTVVLAALLSIVLLVSGTPIIEANANSKKPIVVLVNYQKVDFPDDFEPFIIKGTTMVPVRGAFEKMNAKVTWKRNATGKIEVTAKHFDTTVVMIEGSRTAYRNGKAVQLLEPADLRNGRLSVPLRFISEAFGGKVDWVPSSKSGHKFDYIRIEGQFKFPNKPDEVSTSYNEVGYGEPYEIKSLPLTIKHDTFNLTIHGISNSLPITRIKGTDALSVPAKIENEPDFDGIKNFDSGVIRFDVEFEATTEQGHQVDELQMNTQVFNVVYNNLITTVNPSSFGGDYGPNRFHGFLENVWLEKGEKARGILPIEYIHRGAKGNEVIVNFNTRSINKIALKFNLDTTK